MSDSVAFLYTGEGATQQGVAPGTIDPHRVAVLRGQVRDRSGAALKDVEITIHDDGVYGRTFTRDDGMFDMAVNGGALLTVSYAKPGYLPAHRQVEVPWQDYAWLPDVVLVPLDGQVTPVAVDSTQYQVARGTATSDDDGARQATLLFPPGTTGEVVMPDGTSQPLGPMSVRATEYTVGAEGEQAMPAELPVFSGYTYAVEFSVDQAIAGGASEVRFNQPIFNYTENFLNFPVGSLVPAGYYDRDRATWVASENGRVIAILSHTGGRADVDADGDGQPDTADQLAALGITDGEREQLASLYAAGSQIWRTPIPHFTPWDLNWPYGCPDEDQDGAPDCQTPDQPPITDDTIDDACRRGGSVIACENQSLGQIVPVSGTPFSLAYWSDRTPGRVGANQLSVPLTMRSGIPSILKRVELEVDVAGQTYRTEFPADQGQTALFTWDGKDGYGRQVQGRQPATVRIGYVYPVVYLGVNVANSFAQLGGLPLTGSAERAELTLWQVQQVAVGSFDTRGFGLGGWSIDAHHLYDPRDRTLYLGDGSRRTADALPNVITTVAGGHHTLIDGVPARESSALSHDVEAAPDGGFYLADPYSNRIRRVGPDGIITTVAGTGTQGSSGDGGPATEAQLNEPHYISLAPDGSLYISERGGHRIRRIAPDGIITTVGGTGTRGWSADGGPATASMIDRPQGVAAAPDGSVYFVDWAHGGPGTSNRVRRIGTDGVLTTVAGGSIPDAWDDIGDGGPGPQASLNNADDVAVGPDGSVYVADGEHFRVRRVGPDGIITTYAGGGEPVDNMGDGGPATQAALGWVKSLSIGPDGTMFISTGGVSDKDVTVSYNRIRKVAPDGTITTFVGNGGDCFWPYDDCGDGGPATRATLESPNGLSVSPQGLLLTDHLTGRVRLVGPAMPGTSAEDTLIPGSDGTEAYLFDARGRHLRTHDALTGAVLLTFSYDGNGRLAAVEDTAGNRTQVERDPDGRPVALVAPFGERTAITTSADGYLTSITDPAGGRTELGYDAGGLLTSLTEPTGGTRRYTYDAGRLIRAEDPDGAVQTLSRDQLAGGFAVEVTTKLDRTTRYEWRRLAAGGRSRVLIDPDGTRTEMTYEDDGTVRRTDADGTSTRLVLAPDPRWGMQAPLSTDVEVLVPGGPTTQMTVARSAELADAGDPLSVRSLSETSSVNGDTSTGTYTASTRTWTEVSPEGRSRSWVLDEHGRVTTFRPGQDLDPVSWTYDSRGRVSAVEHGSGAATRRTELSYDSNRLPAGVTDPLGRTTSYDYDAAGRTTRVTDPSGNETLLTYNGAGNALSVTGPGGSTHAFAYTAGGLLERYTLPTVGSGAQATSVTYDGDREPSRISTPASAVDLAYDTAGRAERLSFPDGTLSAGYDDAGRAVQLAAPGANLARTYAGRLLTGLAWTGDVSGAVTRTFDDHRRVSSLKVGTLPAIGFTYDADGNPTAAGDMTLSYTGGGLPAGSTLGNTVDTYAYSPLAEPTGYEARASGSEIFTTSYDRDALGRITGITERIAGSETLWTYAYDQGGRLVEVRRDGQLDASYGYDANGNRTTTSTGGTTTAATYDAQDRLVSWGGRSYTYAPTGHLASVANAGQTTTYDYDELGNLRAVDLPDGRKISYVVDAEGRRIGKKVDGSLVSGLLYSEARAPAAMLGPDGAVTARFAYGSRSHVPDQMVTTDATYRLITDHLGSVRLVVDVATGAVAQRLDYDAFGRIVIDTNPGFQPFGFAGGLHDGDTGLVRFGVRDYDPETGRWTARDPIGFHGGDTNLYAYVGNDPVNHIDPEGTLVLALIVVVVAIGLIALAVSPTAVALRRNRMAQDDCDMTNPENYYELRRRNAPKVEQVTQATVEGLGAAGMGTGPKESLVTEAINWVSDKWSGTGSGSGGE